MKLVRTLAPLVVGIALGMAVSPSIAGPSEEALARRLMAATGAADLGKQMMDAMMNQMKGMPGMRPELLERIAAEADTDELTELVVPIYTNNLDEKTLKAAVKFFESPAGQKLAEAQPAIMAESMTAGQQWGQQLVQRVLVEGALDRLDDDAPAPE